VSEDYGRRAVEAAQVDVIGGGQSLTVRSNFDDIPYKDGGDYRSKALPDIHYLIRAPRSLNLSIDVDRSRVEAQGFKGKINLTTDRTMVAGSDLSGDIHIKIDRGEARLSNLRGALDIETDRTSSKLRAVHIDGDSQIEIDRGDIELSIPGSQKLTVSAVKNRRADFENDFGLALNSSGGNSIEGTINGGGPKLSIRADRGRVSLRRE
jgi:hypothetical protein